MTPGTGIKLSLSAMGRKTSDPAAKASCSSSRSIRGRFSEGCSRSQIPTSDVPAYSSKGRLIRTSVRPQPTHVAIVWLRDEAADGVSSNTARITSVGWSHVSSYLLGYTNRMAILDRNILVNFTMLIQALMPGHATELPA